MPRSKRPLEFYKTAWEKFTKLRHDDTDDRTQTDKALEAFQYAGQQFPDVQLSGCMTTRSYALSHMKDDVKRKVVNAYGAVSE
jgi:hypothetical protein